MTPLSALFGPRESKSDRAAPDASAETATKIARIWAKWRDNETVEPEEPPSSDAESQARATFRDLLKLVTNLIEARQFSDRDPDLLQLTLRLSLIIHDLIK
jgi:hypothetical protein